MAIILKNKNKLKKSFKDFKMKNKKEEPNLKK
jgi:hypothetical protein